PNDGHPVRLPSNLALHPSLLFPPARRALCLQPQPPTPVRSFQFELDPSPPPS
ncbi:hypothetical protein FRC00_008662, partial [Tulasnella sp. 408]